MPLKTSTSSFCTPSMVPTGAETTASSLRPDAPAPGELAKKPPSIAQVVMKANWRFICFRMIKPILPGRLSCHPQPLKIISQPQTKCHRTQPCITAIKKRFRMDIGDFLTVKEVFDISCCPERPEICPGHKINHSIGIGKIISRIYQVRASRNIGKQARKFADMCDICRDKGISLCTHRKIIARRG